MTLKIATATGLILIGIACTVVGTVVPSTTCVQTTAYGEIVADRCRTAESLANLTSLALVIGIASTIFGTAAAWRASDGTDRMADVASGLILLVAGLFTTYLYGSWFWNVVAVSFTRVHVDWVDLAAMPAFAGIGLLVASIGGRTLWKTSRAERRRI